MRSDIPGFQGLPASEEDDARWEAYRALLRRTGGAQAPGPEADREDQDEAFDRADDGPGWEASAEPVDVDDPDEQANAGSAEASPGELAILEHRARAAAPSAGRSGRLLVAVTAVTAGIVFAAALVPQQQGEPAVVAVPIDGAGSAMPTPVPPPKSRKPKPSLAKRAEPPTSTPPTLTPSTEAPDTQAGASQAFAGGSADTRGRAHRFSREGVPEQSASAQDGALSCWLAVMNNQGSRDGGLSICGDAAPTSGRPAGRAGSAANRD
jgi:hypothetical protein